MYKDKIETISKKNLLNCPTYRPCNTLDLLQTGPDNGLQAAAWSNKANVLKMMTFNNSL